MTPIPTLLIDERDKRDVQRDDASSAPEPSSTGVGESDPVARLTVLLVEDDAELAESWSHSLRFAGYECAIAPDASSALALLADETRRIAIMIADLHVAGSDGGALIRAAHDMPRYSGLPVIITSGDDTQAARERVRRAGMNAYLVKPVPITTLLQAIARWTRAKSG